MKIVRLGPGYGESPLVIRWYFVCEEPECGWAAPLRSTHADAAMDGRRHREAKLRAAREASA